MPSLLKGQSIIDLSFRRNTELSPAFLPPCLSQVKLLAQPVGPYQWISLSSQASSSDLGILHPPLGNGSNSFALSQTGVGKTNTSEADDGEIAGADLGQEGGGQLGVTDGAQGDSHLIHTYL